MSYLQFNTSFLLKFILSGCGLVVVTMCFGNTNNFYTSRIPGKLLTPFVSSVNSSVDENSTLIDLQKGDLNTNIIGQLFEISKTDQLVSDISGIPSIFILSDTPVSNLGTQAKSSRGTLANSISDCCCCCCC